MIGVRKNSGVIRLLMAAALVLFVAACSSSSDNSGLERERDQALETVEELEGTIVRLDRECGRLDGAVSGSPGIGNCTQTKTRSTDVGGADRGAGTRRE